VQICLRQQGVSDYICSSFLRSASAKTNYKKKEKYHCEKARSGTAYVLLLKTQPNDRAQRRIIGRSPIVPTMLAMQAGNRYTCYVRRSSP
jgi:hypothetical protein